MAFSRFVTQTEQSGTTPAHAGSDATGIQQALPELLKLGVIFKHNFFHAIEYGPGRIASFDGRNATLELRCLLVVGRFRSSLKRGMVIDGRSADRDGRMDKKE